MVRMKQKKNLNHTIHCSRQAQREQKKNDEKSNGKTAEVFRKVMESIQEQLEANKLERANIVLKQLFKIESLTLDVDGYVLIKENQHSLKLNLFCTIHSKTQKKHEGVFYPQILKELNLDPSLVSKTYAKQILRSLKSEAAKLSTSSSFVSDDNPTTEYSKRSKPSSSKTRSTTLKPKTKQSDKRKTQKKEFFPTTNDNDDDDDKNYGSSKESFATTSTKEWKSYYQ